MAQAMLYIPITPTSRVPNVVQGKQIVFLRQSATGAIGTAQVVSRAGGKVVVLPQVTGQAVNSTGVNPVMIMPHNPQAVNSTGVNPVMIMPHNPRVTLQTNQNQVQKNPIMLLPGTVPVSISQMAGSGIKTSVERFVTLPSTTSATATAQAPQTTLEGQKRCQKTKYASELDIATTPSKLPKQAPSKSIPLKPPPKPGAQKPAPPKPVEQKPAPLKPVEQKFVPPKPETHKLPPPIVPRQILPRPVMPPVNTTMNLSSVFPATSVAKVSKVKSKTTATSSQRKILPKVDEHVKFREQYVKLIMYFDADFECDICYRLFESKHHLALHVFDHSDKEIQTFLDRARKKGLSLHASKKSDRNVCEKCSQEFIDIEALIGHQKVHYLNVAKPKFEIPISKGKLMVEDAKIGKMGEEIEKVVDSFLEASQSTEETEPRGLNLLKLIQGFPTPLRPSVTSSLQLPPEEVSNYLDPYPDPTAYICPKCPLIFENFDDLDLHVVSHEKKGGTTEASNQSTDKVAEGCSQDEGDLSINRTTGRNKPKPIDMSEMLHWRNRLFNHEKDLEQKYDCVSCSEVIYGRTPFLIHLVCHGVFDRGRYYCDKCWDVVYVSYNDLVKHQANLCRNKDLDVKNLICKICDEDKFKFPAQLDSHYKYIHDSDFPYVCEHCPFVSSTYLDFMNHTEIHVLEFIKADIGMRCIACDMDFESQVEVADHLWTIHGSENASADELDSSIAEPDMVEDHGSEMAEDLYKCEICNKEFALEVYYKRHKELVHQKSVPNDTSPNPAPNPALVNDRVLSVGLRSLTYRCKECPKTYKYLTSFQAHMQAYPQGPYKCDQCPSVFGLYCGLRSHKRTHEYRPNDITCKKCGRLFKYATRFANHICDDRMQLNGKVSIAVSRDIDPLLHVPSIGDELNADELLEPAL
jgi:hypothetical protein